MDDIEAEYALLMMELEKDNEKKRPEKKNVKARKARNEEIDVDLDLNQKKKVPKKQIKNDEDVLHFNPINDLRTILEGGEADDNDDLNDEYLALLNEINEEEQVPKQLEPIVRPEVKICHTAKQREVEPPKQIAKEEKKEPEPKAKAIRPPTRDDPAREENPKRHSHKPAKEVRKEEPEPADVSISMEFEVPKKEKTLPPPKTVSMPEKPAPIAKRVPVAPKDYIDEKATPEYEKIFEAFADSFYSFIHGTKTRGVFLNQVKTLAPIVIAGPQADIGVLELVVPKRKAKQYRTYEEFCKDPICTAENEEEWAGIVAAMERQIKEMKADAALLLSYNDKVGAKKVAEHISLVSQSLAKVKEEPYYVPELVHYYLPELNQDIQPGKMRIHISKIIGFDYKNPVSVVLRIPNGENSIQVFQTKETRPPNFEIDYTTLSNTLELHNPAFLVKLRSQPVGIGIMAKNGDLVTCGSFSLARLLVHKDALFSVSLDNYPGAVVVFDISMHNAIAAYEKRNVSKPVILAPSVVFKTTQPAPTAPSKAPSKTMITSKQHVTPVQAKQQIRPKQVTIPRIYVPTDEEVNMFWGSEVMDFWINASKVCIEKSKAANVPVQNGVEYMNRLWTAKKEQLLLDIENEILTAEEFMKKLQSAIVRENKRLPTFTDDYVQGEHRGFLKIMEHELSSFM